MVLEICQNEAISLLEVHSVGAYSVSIAPTLLDLRRIDPKVFKVSKGIDNVLGTDYSTGFSFVICCISGKSVKSHPIAFTHAMPSENQLFVPTKHAHNGEAEMISDWDHELYTVNVADQYEVSSSSASTSFLGMVSWLLGWGENANASTEVHKKLETVDQYHQRVFRRPQAQILKGVYEKRVYDKLMKVGSFALQPFHHLQYCNVRGHGVLPNQDLDLKLER